MRPPFLSFLQCRYSASVNTRCFLLCLLIVTIGCAQSVIANDSRAQTTVVVLEKEHRERVKLGTSNPSTQTKVGSQIDYINALIEHHQHRVVVLQKLDNKQREIYLQLDGLSQLKNFLLFTSRRLDYLRQVIQHYVAIGSLQGRLMNLVGVARSKPERTSKPINAGRNPCYDVTVEAGCGPVT